ncbi:hypothetical protein [Euzebya pacifica]|uniref:hypothetical protein n=1 Tax=Euzebya pacifica TaxID=1608957 RepID=UPI000DF7CB7C|nr:hypothetical protein [Euzebya pacifica]
MDRLNTEKIQAASLTVRSRSARTTGMATATALDPTTVRAISAPSSIAARRAEPGVSGGDSGSGRGEGTRDSLPVASGLPAGRSFP